MYVQQYHPACLLFGTSFRNRRPRQRGRQYGEKNTKAYFRSSNPTLFWYPITVVLIQHILSFGGVALDERADFFSFPCTWCTWEMTRKTQMTTTLCTCIQQWRCTRGRAYNTPWTIDSSSPIVCDTNSSLQQYLVLHLTVYCGPRFQLLIIETHRALISRQFLLIGPIVQAISPIQFLLIESARNQLFTHFHFIDSLCNRVIDDPDNSNYWTIAKNICPVISNE